MRRLHPTVSVLCRCVLAGILSASGAGPSEAAAQALPEDARKQARAVRVPAGAIRLDGRLDEQIWDDVPAITDFVQKEPIEGAPPSDPMVVRIAYDDNALYVGARMHSSTPIQAPLGRRDEGNQAEHFLVSLDTYLDRRTASTFGVTAAGARMDHYHSSDDENNRDEGYDPVWQARTARTTAGWTAELWIPFSQLRFNERPAHVWGLNLQRFVPSRNEEVFWALIPRTDSRWASLFGTLVGIEGIRPSRRLELLPYVAGSSQVVGSRVPGDPFNGGGNPAGRIGVDAKVGIGPNLTLEATVNPDFGQVEADPAEVNLTAFETFFSERRPFFQESSQLLSGPVNNYFYSRRIGAPPPGTAEGEFVDYPSTTSILGAAKLSGRLASGTSIAVLGAATAEESARTFTRQQFGRAVVAPRALFGVARIEQEFGPPGSTAALMSTVVKRDLEAGDPLASLLTRNAFSLSGDTLLRLRGGEYEVRAAAGLSYVDGDPLAIDRLQRSSARYFQRPDANYVEYDPARTSLTGMKAHVSADRRTGRHWLFGIEGQLESPEFETNDLGRTTSSDGISTNGRIEYRETVPGRWWRDYSVRLSSEAEWNYGGDRQKASLSPRASITWPNFWETDLGGTFNYRAQDERLTRGGPSMQTPQGWRVNLDIENSNAASTRGEFALEYGRDENDGLLLSTSARVVLRPGSRWELSARPEYERVVDARQYVSTIEDGGGKTFGRRYVFGGIDRSTYSTEFRLNYTFKPDLTLDFYAEPFAASGQYAGFGELAVPRTSLLRIYGTDGTHMTRLDDGRRLIADGGESFVLPNRDFNVLSFRSNLVLRWEWRPGSTLYLVWQQDRAAEYRVGSRATIGDLFDSIGQTGDHFFAVKASFWFSPR